MKLSLFWAFTALSFTVTLLANNVQAVKLTQEEAVCAQTDAQAEGCFGSFCCGTPPPPVPQRCPNINVVDAGKIMIPEGADPTAVKFIIGDVMNSGIVGYGGGKKIAKELAGCEV